MNFVKVFKGQDQWVFLTSVTPEDLSRTANQWQIILSALQPHSFLHASNFVCSARAISSMKILQIFV